MTLSQLAGQQLEGTEALVRSLMKEEKIPGVAVAVVTDTQVLLSQGFGQRNMTENLEVTEQTLFAIGSCTKAFTAMALAILVDEGKLDWDTPVRYYLPSFKLADPFISERLTPRDLLIHSSGLPEYILSWYNSPISRKELVERLQYLDLTHDLRTTWQYNNMMYATAGYLLEVLSGQSWEDFTRQRIFEPLGMTSTIYSGQAYQLSPDFSQGYREINHEVQPVKFYERFQAVGPAGSIIANLRDITKWLHCLLNKGQYGESGQRLVSEIEFTRLITPQIVIPDAPLASYDEIFYWLYAFGWCVFSYRGHIIVQHSGGIDGFSALFTFLPDDHFGIIALSNLEGSFLLHETVTYTLCDRLLALPAVPWRERFTEEQAKAKEQQEKSKQETVTGKVPDAPPSHPLSAYTGEFSHPGFGSFSITLADGHLKGLFNDLEYTFSHHHYDIFDVHEARFDISCKASFVSNLEGAIDSFSFTMGGLASKPFVFRRTAQGEPIITTTPL